ncbi:BsuPI-related putative proteinase inhibitor [Tuberibacillus sp. Marseille-P3662]|uniref:BsuPI-related putative proteinase inhibitor n=1 Tax=Tuberibacillus sp. Marseille-P3662 TaxID=1965358 RepID=UPI000A1C8302|nr:BsuPI-related putative proteinase inhibitor [Tuberibacillus sp. Marseille-P3662]
MIKSSFFSLVCIMSVFILPACGDASMDNPSSKTNPSDNPSQPAQSGGIVAGRVEPSLSYKQSGDGAKVTFSLKNQTEHIVTYHFNTSQRFDYIIKSQDGQIVKQYSKDRMFNQVLGTEKLKQGETMTYHTTIDDLSSGTYTLKFWLVSNESPQPEKSITLQVH